jgi:putative ABC exporter
MLGTLRAFAYLTWHTLRNRTLTRLRRVKNPRYAISALIGAAYFWFFLIHNPSRMPRDVGALFSDALVVIATVGLVVFASTWWLFGGDKTTLTFSLAETAFLFPAPLSRRAVIGYKLFRAQLAILINAMIFIFLMRRGIGFLPSGYRAISLWVLFTTLNFHRVGAALVRASWVEHKRHGVRRNALPAVVLATVIIGVTVAVLDGWPAVNAVARDKGFFDAVAMARTVLDQAPASIVLWPVHAIVTPVFALSRSEWAATIPFAMLVLMLHAWWVVRTDAAFEEASIAASHDRVRLIEAWRSRRLSAPPLETVSRRGLHLPNWGHPAVAIVWKNILCLRRTIRLRVFIAPLMMATVWGSLIGAGKGIVTGIAIGAVTFAAMLTFFGPMLVRNDLRQDMQNLLALKVLPLRGRTIVMAEVMSSAIPIAVAQYAALIIGGVAAVVMPDPIPLGIVASAFVASLPALLAFASAMVAVQNGAPVLFPGWVRLGAVVGGGMENLGQGVLSMGIILILVALMMVVPAGLVVLALFVVKPLGWAVAILAAITLGSAALGAEVYGVFNLLGRTLERTEPSETAYA